MSVHPQPLPQLSLPLTGQRQAQAHHGLDEGADDVDISTISIGMVGIFIEAIVKHVYTIETNSKHL